MISKFLSIPINSVTPRVFELRKKGYVERSHTSPCDITQRSVIYWKTVSIGNEAYIEYKTANTPPFTSSGELKGGTL